nr:Ig-like domain-containing protein [Massilia polaris]
MAGPSQVNLGESADLVATLVDSANRPISGETVSASVKNGNVLATLSTISDSQGEVRMKLQGSQRGDEQVTVSALGASAAKPVTVSGSELVLLPAVTVGASGVEMLKEIMVDSCSPVDGRYMTAQTGTVTLTTSRGTLFRDAACTQALAGSLSIANGSVPRTYIRSASAGVSTVDAVIAGGPAASTRLEFVAPLAASARLNLQADLAVLGSGERSNLIAVVRDGTPANNLVKGALVQFSILADPSGGNLVSPFSAVSGSDGVARGWFVAGPADGGKDGTVLQARLAALPGATASTALTVNRKALSIQFGTGNSLFEYSPTVLQKEFSVFVSDSAGSPVKDVAISVAAWPTMYRKGRYAWQSFTPPLLEPGMWVQFAPITPCDNEDVARRGLYDRAFDRNGNGVLEPGIPLSVVSGGRTDAFGMTTVSLRYPRDRANWVRVELTVSGTVAGTESRARNALWLPALADDLARYTVSPPGEISPYGESASCASSL